MLRARTLLLALPLLSAGCGRADGRWNVLLVTLDTFRADRIHAYGWPEPTTPNLDRLAAEGARFERAWGTAAVTPVAHASILTGRFNHEHGVRVMSADGGFRLPPAERTLFEELSERGWETGAFHSAFPVSSWFGFERGFDVFEELAGRMERNGDRDQWAIGEKQRRSDETTDLALRFLARADEPWDAWIHYWDPHDTVLLPPPESWPHGLPAPDDELAVRMEKTREIYAAEVAFVDRQIGRLLERLRERGELERTIVCVVADHGEGLGDHGWWFHRLLYEEQVRVPLILRVPGAPAGVVARAQVRTVDIAPTVLDYLGLPVPARMSGRSLRPLLEDRPDAPRLAFADQINGYDKNAGLVADRPADRFLYAVTDGRWKLVWRPAAFEQSELFHLAEDPGETRNLFAFDHPEVRRLAAELVRERPWVTQAFRPDGGTTPGERAAVQGGLGDLGYAGSAHEDGLEWRWLCLDDPRTLLDAPAPCADDAGPLPVLAP
jgi:arylsulfatase A-like enzyme